MYHPLLLGLVGPQKCSSPNNSPSVPEDGQGSPQKLHVSPNTRVPFLVEMLISHLSHGPQPALGEARGCNKAVLKGRDFFFFVKDSP